VLNPFSVIPTYSRVTSEAHVQDISYWGQLRVGLDRMLFVYPYDRNIMFNS